MHPHSHRYKCMRKEKGKDKRKIKNKSDGKRKVLKISWWANYKYQIFTTTFIKYRSEKAIHEKIK